MSRFIKENNRFSEIFFYILIPSWNAFEYFDCCINSVSSQSYTNYKILFVDDCSDYTKEQKRYIHQKLNKHIVRFNIERKFAVRNIYEMLHEYTENDNAIVVNLDGDDWLLHENVLLYLAKIYKKRQCYLTYGECLVWDGKNLSQKPARFLDNNWNIPYPQNVIANNTYRREPFYPLHLRSWKLSLYKKILKKDFQEDGGKWLKFCYDLAIYFPVLEMVQGKYFVPKIPLSVYNMGTPYSDIKVHRINLLRDELIIRRKTPYTPLF